jgi:hypothetical protein
MENKNGQEFYTEAHLSKCIEIPIYTVTEGLNKFVEFKGLLTENVDSTPFYVDGYIIIDEARRIQTGEDEYEATLVRAKCSKYCSRPELENNSYIVPMPFLIEESFISYSEFKIALTKFGIPLIEEAKNVQTKNFNYDVSLVNRKSNFTLRDAAKIAANTYTTGFGGFSPQLPSPSDNHYLELLSDCVKGVNQDGFYITTEESWYNYIDFEGESIRSRCDQDKLNLNDDINNENTFISKSEFLRWCKYENIETGLSQVPRDFEPSTKELQAEIQQLKCQINRPQRPIQQQPPSILNKNYSEKIEQLNTKISELTQEVELLKCSSFPVMTLKLKAALAAQNKYWLDYDRQQLPLQKNIQQHIQETLNIELTTDNRLAKSLSVAIQPDEIKRN